MDRFCEFRYISPFITETHFLPQNIQVSFSWPILLISMNVVKILNYFLMLCSKLKKLLTDFGSTDEQCCPLALVIKRVNIKEQFWVKNIESFKIPYWIYSNYRYHWKWNLDVLILHCLQMKCITMKSIFIKFDTIATSTQIWLFLAPLFSNSNLFPIWSQKCCD